MKKILQLACGLVFSTISNAQTTQLPPQKQIEQQRKQQVQAQEPAPDPVIINTARTQPAAPLENRTTAAGTVNTEAVQQPSTVTTTTTDQKSPDNIGGAGTSGTAPNTIGAPVKATTNTANSNRTITTKPPATQNISNGTNATRRGTNSK